MPVLRWHLEREGIQTTDEAQLEQIVVSQRERAKTVREMALNSVFFFRAPAAYDEKAVRKHVTADVLALLAEVRGELDRLRTGRHRPFTNSSALLPRQRACRLASWRSPFAWRCAVARCRRPSMPPWPFWEKPRHCRDWPRHRPPGARSLFIFLTNWSPSGNVPRLLWGHSSAGRALAWHARGRRFDPAWLHQFFVGD